MIDFRVVIVSPLHRKWAGRKTPSFPPFGRETWGLWKASRASGYPRPPLGGRTRTPLETIHSPQNHEETEDSL